MQPKKKEMREKRAKRQQSMFHLACYHPHLLQDCFKSRKQEEKRKE